MAWWWRRSSPTARPTGRVSGPATSSLVSIDGKPVEEPRQVVDGLQRAQAEGDRVVLLLIMRNGEQIFEAVPLASS